MLMTLTSTPRSRSRAALLLPAALGTALLLAGCATTDDRAATADALASEATAVAFDGAHVSADEFAAAVAGQDVVVIDVRTAAEHAEGHLPGAVNLDVQGPAFASQVAALDPDVEYAVYCRSGSRSRAAMDAMGEAGIARTVGLEGGITAWQGEVVAGEDGSTRSGGS